MIGQPQIVVGAQVYHAAARHLNLSALRRGDHPFAFHHAVSVDLREGFGDVGEVGLRHENLLSWKVSNITDVNPK